VFEGDLREAKYVAKERGHVADGTDGKSEVCNTGPASWRGRSVHGHVGRGGRRPQRNLQMAGVTLAKEAGWQSRRW
jgi:hypothetical protein